MAGKKSDDLDERVGYYGEHLVLLAQMLGLNTCWVGLSYSKVPGTFVLANDEKIACYIALGYGETQGASHKVKTIEQVSNVSDITPSWFKRGVQAALYAPTAINQQNFYFEYVRVENNQHKVLAKKDEVRKIKRELEKDYEDSNETKVSRASGREKSERTIKDVDKDNVDNDFEDAYKKFFDDEVEI